MAKDINIHLKAHGAERTKQQLGGVAQASKQVGDKTAEGHKKGAGAVDKTTQKMTGMGRILGNLKSQVLGFVGAWLSIRSVKAVLDWFIAKLERISKIQEDIHTGSLNLLELGQALEFQTKTIGKQQEWAEFITKIQQAGGLAGPEIASGMLVAMDLAFKEQGGIKSQQVQELAAQLAPFIGAAGLGAEEVTKLFEFAGIANVKPTEVAYKEYFAKLWAGYTASKATDFGQYMMGLQKSATAYMAAGGTFEEAISTYAGARSVMSNEAVAATLLEQVTRLSTGAYERPRKAIEKNLGIRWEDLSMDERKEALLRHVLSTPQASRERILVEQGFPVELTGQISKIVSAEATRAMEETRKDVATARPEDVDALMDAYLRSSLGKERQVKADISLGQLKKMPEIAPWQRRIDKARADFDLLLHESNDRWIRDSLEPYVMALEDMKKDIKKVMPTLSKDQQTQAKYLLGRIHFSLYQMSDYPISLAYPEKMAKQVGYRYNKELRAIINKEPFEPYRGFTWKVNEKLYNKYIAPVAGTTPIPVPIETESVEGLPPPVEPIEIHPPAESATQPPIEQPPPIEETPVIPPISREVGVPVPGPPPFTEEIVPQQTVNNINYHFSHDLHYHPRVGSDESGPRVASGVMA